MKRYDIWVENGKRELVGLQLDDLENEAFKKKEKLNGDNATSLNKAALTSNNISIT